MYQPSDFGKEEEKLIRKYFLQVEDARNYFLNCIRPRLDRSYKLYIAFNGDRAKEIKKWQSNIFVPYIQSVVETLMPRILDARPDFSVQGRNEDSQLRAVKLQTLCDYTWEKAKADKVVEDLVRSSLVYGSGYMQVSWKKDVREHDFLVAKDLNKKKLKWETREQVFYDAPTVEWVDNYSLWYDWHNIKRESKQFWFKRSILTGQEIKRRYPGADPKRIELALGHMTGDLADYAAIRNNVKLAHWYINKGSDFQQGGTGAFTGSATTWNIYQSQADPDLKMHEVFDWYRPFDDAYTVMVNNVPILKGGSMPIPYDFKEAPFIDVPYLKVPAEFEGYGIPMILENPQIMLNTIKNQRLDAMTLNIHKMWIVNPLANINKQELVTRPFGIVYSTDPNGVREIEFSDVKSSAYQEEELIKGDMRYASGVDDFSMGGGQAGQSATAVRHLRESTLERVRLFVNHLGDGFSDVIRYWMSMYSQFFTDKMIIRIVGDDGNVEYPIIEKDDLKGEFDFRAVVLPSIAGQNDINKKQDMDLFQLLITLPFIDPKKLTSKVLRDWNWSLEAISKAEGAPEQQLGPDGQPLPPEMQGQQTPPGMEGQQMPPEMMAAMQGGMAPGMDPNAPPPPTPSGEVPPEVMDKVMAMLGTPGVKVDSPNRFAEASRPINLLNASQPPTVPDTSAGGGPGPGAKTTNLRGMNRGGKVNTNINVNHNSNPTSALLNRTFNLQR
jgi:hypothetical protein